MFRPPKIVADQANAQRGRGHQRDRLQPRRLPSNRSSVGNVKPSSRRSGEVADQEQRCINVEGRGRTFHGRKSSMRHRGFPISGDQPGDAEISTRDPGSQFTVRKADHTRGNEIMRISAAMADDPRRGLTATPSVGSGSPVNVGLPVQWKDAFWGSGVVFPAESVRSCRRKPSGQRLGSNKTSGGGRRDRVKVVQSRSAKLTVNSSHRRIYRSRFAQGFRHRARRW